MVLHFSLCKALLQTCKSNPSLILHFIGASAYINLLTLGENNNMKVTLPLSAIALALSMSFTATAQTTGAPDTENTNITGALQELLVPEKAPKTDDKKSTPEADPAEAAEKESDEADPAKEDEKKEKTFADIVEDMTHIPGYVDIYQDPKTGAAKLVIDKDMLNTPVLYFAQTVNGVTDVRHFRGAYRSEKILEFRQHFDRLDVVAPNNSYVFDKNNALSKAADANTSEAILVSTKIEFDNEGKIVVDLGSVVLNENIHRIAPMPSRDPKRDKDRFKLGKLSKDKTRYNDFANFPENTHVVVDYVYENMTPRNGGTGGNADARFTTISLQHAFVKLPENNFKPRQDDARVGYFGTYKEDQTTPSTTPYVDFITRWHLEKKDPDAAVSDPVEPIVWWIENTTPVEWRDTIKEGVLAWNSAFEKAGISNALEVRVQPDDADWSADDVRYNVLRWTSSPRAPFGGYGPSLANPENGQIIGADIMLEFVFMSNRWLYEGMFTQGSMLALEHEQYSAVAEESGHNALRCSKGFDINAGIALGNLLGNDMIGGGSTPADIYDLDKNEIARQGLLHLILHEVGHTLGLNHNMKASTTRSVTDVHDASVTQGAITASVMDYAPINLAPVGEKQGDYYDYAPGTYDDWAINYGYSIGLADPVKEAERLEAILSQSTLNAHIFGNDADDMRAPGVHIDPHVMIGDMSADAVTYAEQYIERMHDIATKLRDKVLQPGESHQDLLVAANIVAGSMSTQTGVMSRYIGGVHVNRAVVGQAGYDKPYTPVAEAKQKQAMAALAKHLFAADAIDDIEPLLAYLQRQRRGFYGYGKNEDPKPHDLLLNMQKRVFDHVLHPAVQKRITDSTKYGNTYPLHAVMEDLTQAIFADDMRGDVNTYRQNLQVEYVERLIAISGLEKTSRYDNIAEATALYTLKQLDESLNLRRGNTATKIHRSFLKDRIARAFHKSKS